nr:MAG: hypothetical protein [Rhabdoviridae sp.]
MTQSPSDNTILQIDPDSLDSHTDLSQWFLPAPPQPPVIKFIRDSPVRTGCYVRLFGMFHVSSDIVNRADLLGLAMTLALKEITFKVPIPVVLLTSVAKAFSAAVESWLRSKTPEELKEAQLLGVRMPIRIQFVDPLPLYPVELLPLCTMTKGPLIARDRKNPRCQASTDWELNFNVYPWAEVQRHEMNLQGIHILTQDAGVLPDPLMNYLRGNRDSKWSLESEIGAIMKANQDFVQLMSPHVQGALEWRQVVKGYGKPAGQGGTLAVASNSGLISFGKQTALDGPGGSASSKHPALPPAHSTENRLKKSKLKVKKQK